MNPWIYVILMFIGAVYLFVVIYMAFKERGMIVGLVVLNIVVFIYTAIFAPEAVTKFALSGAKVSSGMGYTLVTYMFLHVNLAHLFLNSLGLLFFGYHLEKEFGGPPTLMVYFTSGLIAGGVYLWTSDPRVMVVGASGAIFGLMAYLTLVNPFRISPMPFLIPMPVALAAVLFTLASIPLVLNGGVSGGMAHNAHLGGLLGGSLMAFGMNYLRALKGLAIVVAIAILVIIVSAALA